MLKEEFTKNILEVKTGSERGMSLEVEDCDEDEESVFSCLSFTAGLW